MRLKKGQSAPPFELRDIFENNVSLEALRGKRSMISFYRYSGCPFCNLRVAGLIKKYPEFEKSGLTMISFWQSPKEDILGTVGSQKAPFALIPDPEKRVYTLYGVENDLWAPLKALFDVRHALRVILSPFMNISMTGEIDLVPADFLINPDLTIHTAYYGKSVGDHLPLGDIEGFLNEK